MQVIGFVPFWAEFLAVKYPPADYAPATFVKLRQVAKELRPFVATTADLTPANLAAWRDSKPSRTALSHNGMVVFARRACQFAHAAGYVERNPFAVDNYRRRVVGRPRPRRHLGRAEMARLLDHLERQHRSSWAGGRLYALATLLCYAGLRAKEALRLKVEDFDFSAGTVEIVARTRLKTAASEATVPLAPECVPVLAGWADRCGSEWYFPGTRRTGPWVYGSNGRRPADYLDAAGVAAGLPRGTTLLMLRHSLATHARTHFGLSAKAVQQVLRHADVRTQENYIGSDLDNLKAEVTKLRFRVFPEPCPVVASA